jgi:hypothetical protein
MLPAEPSTAIPAVTPPDERKTFYSSLYCVSQSPVPLSKDRTTAFHRKRGAQTEELSGE